MLFGLPNPGLDLALDRPLGLIWPYMRDRSISGAMKINNNYSPSRRGRTPHEINKETNHSLCHIDNVQELIILMMGLL